jgi:hypothetical protein
MSGGEGFGERQSKLNAMARAASRAKPSAGFIAGGAKDAPKPAVHCRQASAAA